MFAIVLVVEDEITTVGIESPNVLIFRANLLTECTSLSRVEPQVGLADCRRDVHPRRTVCHGSNASSLFLVRYANGYVGYVPPLSNLEKAGYEVRAMKLTPEEIVEFQRASLEFVGGSDRHWPSPR